VWGKLKQSSQAHSRVQLLVIACALSNAIVIESLPVMLLCFAISEIVCPSYYLFITWRIFLCQVIRSFGSFLESVLFSRFFSFSETTKMEKSAGDYFFRFCVFWGGLWEQQHPRWQLFQTVFQRSFARLCHRAHASPRAHVPRTRPSPRRSA